MLLFFLESTTKHSVHVANGNEFLLVRDGMDLSDAVSYAHSISRRIGPAIVRKGIGDKSPIVAIFRQGQEQQSLSNIPELKEPPRDMDSFKILIKKFDGMRRMTGFRPKFLGKKPHRNIVYVIIVLVILVTILGIASVLLDGFELFL